MERIYNGINGKQYLICELPLAGGGEGSIYEVSGEQEYVIKIFKDKYRTTEREEKLLKMVEQKLTEEQLTQIAWPIDVVYDEDGFAGYLMPKIKNNKNLNVVYSTVSQLDLRHRLVIAYNLCAAVDIVHSMGQVCGDLNPQNILVDLDMTSPAALHVTMVDTDSYHIKNEDKIYRCEVGLSTYLAPEIQKKLVNGLTLKTAPLPTYSKETDLFSLAIHIFCLIMNGCHPFACAKRAGNSYTHNMEALNSENEDSVVLPQPIENIRNGFFPFLHEVDGITFPLYAPDMKKLPKDLYEMFIKAFELGCFTPSERPTAKEWMRILSAYQGPTHFMKCSNGHYYLHENTNSCPFCDAKQRMIQMMYDTGNKVKGISFEDILTKTEYFEFDIGGFFEGHSKVIVKKIYGSYNVSYFAYEAQDKIKKKLTEEEFREFISVLYYCGLWEWKDEYVNPYSNDGTQWTIKVRLKGENEVEWYGSNEYPPDWEKFFQAINILSVLGEELPFEEGIEWRESSPHVKKTIDFNDFSLGYYLFILILLCVLLILVIYLFLSNNMRHESDYMSETEIMSETTFEVTTTESSFATTEATEMTTEATTVAREEERVEVDINKSEYIFYDSDVRLLTDDEIAKLTPKERCIARNEIYARHGRIFTSPKMVEYFSTISWYVPRYKPDEFDESVFSKIERANMDKIQAYEKKYGEYDPYTGKIK